MFCKYCGKEVNENAVICPNCGVATDNYNKATVAPEQKNTMALIGFILSFFVAIAGLVISIIAYKNAKKPEYNGDGKSFALAGIIISAVSLCGGLIAVIAYIGVFISFLAAMPIY